MKYCPARVRSSKYTSQHTCKGLNIAMHTHTLERDAGYLLETLVHVGTLAPHDVGKVGREDKRGALAFDTELLFEISQEVAEINVEQVAGTGDLNTRKIRKRNYREMRPCVYSKAEGWKTMILSLCRSPMPSRYVTTE